ncbi:tRNA uridine(34) 5-carboxymethylaminomethyl modification radical SAM/GNAT enzyme Elp3 [Candidatus Woesearchaeota archaeon]|nr:MAG: tRNA uridine(34) 5-carboxymethylaminomethyl modification radical SAM/GNAT enzyme Elp3 [Candidatus Woesearchaeota archaeon]
MSKAYYDELIGTLKKKKLSKEQISKLKVKLCSKHKLKQPPTDIEVMMQADEKDLKILQKQLTTKPTRSVSGVSVVALMTKPIKCPHGKCVYCPGGPGSVFGDVPMSYTGKEPSTMRGKRNNYDPYLMVFNRLEQYVVMGHSCDKVELIIQGGTFPSFPKAYQEDFVKYAFKALNDFGELFFSKGRLDIIKFKRFFELPGKVGSKKRTRAIQKRILELKGRTTLRREHERNEKAMIRCVGLTIETRPDYGRARHGLEMLRLGATRVELGIQTTNDKILEKVNRGHTVKESVDSIRELRDLGFKLNFHVMPGLPGSTKKSDIMMLREMFINQDYRPDMLKIYPTMVMPGTGLHEMYKRGEYEPLSTMDAAEIIVSAKKFFPEYVRVMRIQRDIPTNIVSAGVKMTNLRQYVHDMMKKMGIKCRCIRCREPGRTKNIGQVKIYVQEYMASKGLEFFISAEDKKNDIILGFCRMRFPYKSLHRAITMKTALIRELHVYGTAAQIGRKGSIQHRGYGKKLLRKAEEIAKKHGMNKVVVISGVGVREYYYKLGYKKESCYVSKRLA